MFRRKFAECLAVDGWRREPLGMATVGEQHTHIYSLSFFSVPGVYTAQQKPPSGARSDPLTSAPQPGTAMALKPVPRTALQSLLRLHTASVQPTRRAFSTVIDERIDRVSPPLGSAAPTANAALEQAVNARDTRTSWSKGEISDIYNSPLMELAFKSVRRISLSQANARS